MSRFFVGQRVRLKWSHTFPQYVGREGRIVKIGMFWQRHAFELEGRVVEFFGHVMDFDHEFAPEASQLEPILPEGHQPTTWSECLWRPDGSHKTEKVAEEGRAIALRSIL